MARQIIVLRQISGPPDNSGPRTFEVVFWVPVTKTAQQAVFANANAKSRVLDATDTGSGSEMDNLRTGKTIEYVQTCEQAAGMTAASFKADLEARNTALRSKQDNDPWGSFYGSFFDGTTWTVDNSKA